MSFTTTTSFMNLVLPIPTQELGPLWAIELNAALTTVDSHDHTSGKGRKITTGAINIDNSLVMNSQNITQLNSAQFNSLSATLGGSLYASSAYVFNNDLWFTNGAGVPVQITAGGSVITTPAQLAVINYGTASTNTIIGAASPTVFLDVDTTSSLTITLPLSASVSTGRIYCIKDATGNSESQPLTVAAAGGDLIDGQASVTVDSAFGAVFLIANGSSKYSVL